MRSVVVLNPAARGGRNRVLRETLAGVLRDVGIESEVVETRGAGDAERLARAHADAGLVIVAGGDGTVHEAVNGLAGTGAVLGVLPLGTGNDFAHAIGMPDGLVAAAAALAAAPVVPVDVGRVRWEETGEGDPLSHTRIFANSLGAGFDAHVAFLAHETKWLGGRTAYLASVLRTLWAWRHPNLRVRVTLTRAHDADGDGETEVFDGPLFLCEVGNGHSVGGGFHLTPDARPDDGLLDVCLVRHVTPARALRLLPLTFRGGHVGLPEVQMERARRVCLEALTGALALHADGELISFVAQRVEMEVLPGALLVRAPGLPGNESDP